MGGDGLVLLTRTAGRGRGGARAGGGRGARGGAGRRGAAARGERGPDHGGKGGNKKLRYFFTIFSEYCDPRNFIRIFITQ